MKHSWDVIIINLIVSFFGAFLPIVLTVGWQTAAVAGGIAACTNLAGLYQMRPNSPLRSRESNFDEIERRIDR